MIVAGDHAVNDMAGGEEDSWKNILRNVAKITSPTMHHSFRPSLPDLPDLIFGTKISK